MQSRKSLALAATALIASFAATPANAQFLGVNFDGHAIRVDPATGASTLIGDTGHLQLNSMAKLLNGRLVTANNGNAAGSGVLAPGGRPAKLATP